MRFNLSVILKNAEVFTRFKWKFIVQIVRSLCLLIPSVCNTQYYVAVTCPLSMPKVLIPDITVNTYLHTV